MIKKSKDLREINGVTIGNNLQFNDVFDFDPDDPDEADEDAIAEFFSKALEKSPPGTIKKAIKKTGKEFIKFFSPKVK